MKTIKDIVYGTADAQKQALDIYLPDDEVTEVEDVLIYFHGGGLEKGGKGFALQYERLVNSGRIVVSADYRIYPNAVYPDFLEDAASAVKWVKDNLGRYKTFKRIFVCGSSAGAYLTAMLAFDEKYLGVHGIRTTDIAGYIIDSAQMTTHFNVLRERGISRYRIVVDEAAPVYHITENTVFPNALILVSDQDMPCRLEQNLMFLKTAELYGCPEGRMQYKLMEGYKHCGYDKTEVFADVLIHYMDAIV